MSLSVLLIRASFFDLVVSTAVFLITKLSLTSYVALVIIDEAMEFAINRPLRLMTPV